MNETIKMSDNDLAETFGPNWEPVIAVISRAATLTKDEVQRLAAAWNAGSSTAQDAALNAARAALLDNSAGVAARGAALDASWDVAWFVAGDAAGAAIAIVAAATAAAVADLVGQHGLTQDHIDTMMKPWTDVVMHQ